MNKHYIYSVGVHPKCPVSPDYKCSQSCLIPQNSALPPSRSRVLERFLQVKLLSVMASIPSEWEKGMEEGSEAMSHVLGKISKLGKAVAERLLGKDGPEGSLLAEFLFFPNSHQKDQRNTKIREKAGPVSTDRSWHDRFILLLQNA